MFMNIFIIIILILIIILLAKITIDVIIEIDGINLFVNIKIGFLKFTKKVSLIPKNKKKNSAQKKKKISFKTIKYILRYIELDNFEAKIKIGLLFLFPTIFSIPIIAILIEQLRYLPFKKIRKFSYEVLPIYEEVKLIARLKFRFKIRILDIFRFSYSYIRKDF